MFVVLVKLNANPGEAPRLAKMLKSQAAESLNRESGCIRFDVLSDVQGGGGFLLYEIYDSREAFNVHLAMEHTTEFLTNARPLISQKEESYFLPV